jgi:hypothetical protein
MQSPRSKTNLKAFEIKRFYFLTREIKLARNLHRITEVRVCK